MSNVEYFCRGDCACPILLKSEMFIVSKLVLFYDNESISPGSIKSWDRSIGMWKVRR